VAEAKDRDAKLKSFLRRPRRRRRYGRLLLLLIVLLVCYIYLAGDYGLLKIWSQHRQIEELERETHRLRAKQLDLKQQCVKLADDSTYIEKKAREELGMVRPGERVYHFITPQDSTGEEI
jgi:cell division protein FtsB